MVYFSAEIAETFYSLLERIVTDLESIRLLPYTRRALTVEFETLRNILSGNQSSADFPPHHSLEDIKQRFKRLQFLLGHSENLAGPEQTELVSEGHFVVVTTNPNSEIEETFSFSVVPTRDEEHFASFNYEGEVYSSNTPLVAAIIGSRVGEIVIFPGGKAIIREIKLSPLLLEA